MIIDCKWGSNELGVGGKVDLGKAAYPSWRSCGLCVRESFWYMIPCCWGITTGDEGNDMGVSIQMEAV